MENTGDALGRRVSVVLVAMALTVAVATGIPGPAMGASVAVTFELRPGIGASATDDGLTVHSGAPWVLSTTSARSDNTTVTTVTEGAATGREGTAIPLAGLVSYSLVSDR